MAKVFVQVLHVEGLSITTLVIMLSLYQRIYSWSLMLYSGYSW